MYSRLLLCVFFTYFGNFLKAQDSSVVLLPKEKKVKYSLQLGIDFNGNGSVVSFIFENQFKIGKYLSLGFRSGIGPYFLNRGEQFNIPTHLTLMAGHKMHWLDIGAGFNHLIYDHKRQTNKYDKGPYGVFYRTAGVYCMGYNFMTPTNFRFRLYFAGFFTDLFLQGFNYTAFAPRWGLSVYYNFNFNKKNGIK